MVKKLNNFFKFLKEHRKKNPHMSVTEAAKSAGELYRKGKEASNVIVENVAKVAKVTRKQRKGKGKGKGKKTRGRRKGSRKN